jgi:cytochrome c553
VQHLPWPRLYGGRQRADLAGHGATCIFRQLHDIQRGTRKGTAVALMQLLVAKLTENNMIALAAFMASRNP